MRAKTRMSSSSKWPVPSLIALAPPPPFSFSLELQQMVEICSRPPAMGECVCSSFVLLHDGAWLAAHTQDTPAVTSSLTSSLSCCHVFSLMNDYEALMQRLANSLIWLKSRVHVCPSAQSQKFYFKKARWLLRSIQSELSRLHPVVGLMKRVSDFNFSSAAVGWKTNTFSSFRWFILFQSLSFSLYICRVLWAKIDHSWQRKSTGDVHPMSWSYWNLNAQISINTSAGCFFSAAHLIKETWDAQNLSEQR